ncbi:MAG: hypothetical protein ABFD65_13920 [Candidatus Polarisedimenticolia bacterium]
MGGPDAGEDDKLSMCDHCGEPVSEADYGDCDPDDGYCMHCGQRIGEDEAGA